MWEESNEKSKTLRTGLTTGTCATACAVAAAEFHFTQRKLNTVSVTLPKGKTVELTVSIESCGSAVKVSTIKDAGDDPDVTHGATVYVQLALLTEPQVLYVAASGVGTVTRDGLLLAVGEPAINPVPRQMIYENLNACAKKHNYFGGFSVAIGIENGEAIAQKTMNPRLGIMGGLSILGTTGIVRPFSCAAWIASIYQGIDVAYANGVEHIAASTGNSSEQAIRDRYNLDEIALIEMGDFVGAVLKHLKKVPIKRLSLCGGFGKITKLAKGHMDLNSRVSSIDFSHLADTAGLLGASKELQASILNANTSIEAHQLCLAQHIDLPSEICDQAMAVVRNIVPKEVDVELFIINRQGEFIATSSKVALVNCVQANKEKH